MAPGHRPRVGALIPSQNAQVEPEFAAMAPRGVSCHAARMKAAKVSFADPDAPGRMVSQVMGEIEPALDRLMDCRPHVVVLGMGAPSFQGGPDGTKALRERLEDRAGVPVIMPPEAVAAALTALGGITTIAMLSPYMAAVDRQVCDWLDAVGVRARASDLMAASASTIGDIGEPAIAQAIRDIDGPEVGAVVQFGTTMAFAHLVEGAELWLGKPVVAVNVACFWQALRRAGVDDRVDGFGALLARH